MPKLLLLIAEAIAVAILAMVAIGHFGWNDGLRITVSYFIAYLVDDKVKTEEDVQKYLNLTVLGVIPNAGEVSGKKYKKYRRYRSYSSKYQRYQYSSGEDAGEKPAAKKNS